MHARTCAVKSALVVRSAAWAAPLTPLGKTKRKRVTWMVRDRVGVRFRGLT